MNRLEEREMVQNGITWLIISFLQSQVCFLQD
jgi:hypothetical protein